MSSPMYSCRWQSEDNLALGNSYFCSWLWFQLVDQWVTSTILAQMVGIRLEPWCFASMWQKTEYILRSLRGEETAWNKGKRKPTLTTLTNRERHPKKIIFMCRHLFPPTQKQTNAKRTAVFFPLLWLPQEVLKFMTTMSSLPSDLLHCLLLADRPLSLSALFLTCAEQKWSPSLRNFLREYTINWKK